MPDILDEFDFEGLTTDEMIQIQQESVLGQPPSLRTEEQLRFRQLLDKQNAALRKRGLTPDITVEWAGGGQLEGTTGGPIRTVPRRGEVRVSNLERSLREEEEPHGEACCDVDHGPSSVEEKARAVVESILGKDSPLR